MTAAIILAGGLGTRLRKTVPDLPKPMAPVNGRPFLEYVLDYWIRQGVTRFMLSVGYKRDVIRAHFGRQYRGIPLEYAIEETPLGTGGGLLRAAKILAPAQPFLALNGDTFFPVPLETLKEYHAAHGAQWTLALFHADAPGRYGKVTCAADGRVERFSATANLGDPANAGIYLIAPEALASLHYPENTAFSLEQNLLPDFLSHGGRCYGMSCAGQFIDIGVPADYTRAAKILVN